MATFRGYARAELLRAIENLSMAYTHFDHIMEKYKDSHPDIYEQMALICQALAMTAESIQKLHDSI